MSVKKLKSVQNQKLTHNTHNEEQSDESTQASENPVNKNDLRRAVSNPRAASPESLINLQRTYGNQAVQRLIQTSPVSVQRFINPFKKKKTATKPVELPVNNKFNFNELLKNKEFNKLFYAFCITEQSANEIECWLDIEAYKDSPNLPRAKRINNQYFANDKSSKQVNSNVQTKTELNNSINNAESNGNAGTDIFNKALKDVMVNLTDLMSRFQNTSTWKNWRRSNPDVAPLTD